jgi:hypothetical protein
MKEGWLDGGGTSGRSRLSLAVMRHRLDTRSGRDADQLHSPSNHAATCDIGSFVTAPSRICRTVCCHPTGESFDAQLGS